MNAAIFWGFDGEERMRNSTKWAMPIILVFATIFVLFLTSFFLFRTPCSNLTGKAGRFFYDKAFVEGTKASKDSHGCGFYSKLSELSFRTSLFYDKKSHDSLIYLLSAMYECESKESVISEIDRRASSNSGDPDYLTMKFFVHYIYNDELSAMDSLEKIYRLDPRFSVKNGLCPMLVFEYMKHNDIEKGLAVLNRCCKLSKQGYGDEKSNCTDPSKAVFSASLGPLKVFGSPGDKRTVH
jgi:hypothetical protein